MSDAAPQIAIEVPVVKGGWLIPCIESVLAQHSPRWELLMAWDRGDELSRKILERLAARAHPRIRVFFHEERLGIAGNRRFLTDRSTAPHIVPLDDDDLLDPAAVESFIAFADACPWASVLRARRRFIDETGREHAIPDWFPFEPRRYHEGMTADLFNHAQPVAIRRDAYDRTAGWEGFGEYGGAGEDCDMIAKLEEHGEIALLDRILYYYRVHGGRASNSLGAAAAEDMWRRIADATIARRGLPLRRENDAQPFRFGRERRPQPTARDIEVVIAHYPDEEDELPYPWRRPAESAPGHVPLHPRAAVRQPLPATLGRFDRLELCLFSDGPVSGKLTWGLHTESGRALGSGHVRLWRQALHADYLSLPARGDTAEAAEGLIARFEFQPDALTSATPVLAMTRTPDGGGILMRLFRERGGSGASLLRECVASVVENGVPESQIHVISRRAGSAANRNEGLRQCGRRLVCLLDDDAAFAGPGALDALLAGMARLDAHLVSPKILAPDATVFCAAPYFGEDGLPRPRGLGESDTGRYDMDVLVPWLPTTCLLLERCVVLAAGHFDEHYTGSQLEDVDFCLQARSRGFRCGYVGTAAALHHNLQRNFAFGANLPYFQRRWRDAPALFRPLTPEYSP